MLMEQLHHVKFLGLKEEETPLSNRSQIFDEENISPGIGGSPRSISPTTKPQSVNNSSSSRKARIRRKHIVKPKVTVIPNMKRGRASMELHHLGKYLGLKEEEDPL